MSGANSLWQSGALSIGSSGNSNRLEIAGGTVAAPSLYIGTANSLTHLVSTNNLVHIAGGSLFVTNAAGTAPLLVSADGGPINSKATFVTNSQRFYQVDVTAP